MSSVHRRFAAPSLATVIVALALAGGALAQTPARSQAASGPPTSALDPADPARCALWEAPETEAVVTRMAMRPAGYGASTAAVEVETASPTCTFSRRTIEELGLEPLAPLLDPLALGELSVVTDGGDDFVTLDGSALQGSSDATLDAGRVLYGTVDLDRAGARKVARLLGSEEFTDDVDVTSAQRPADLLERGTWQLVILDTAGDPTVTDGTLRYWQLGFQGTNPAKSVAPAIPVATPLTGVRRLFTYGQAPQGGGDTLRFVGESDFGSRKLGPDGQTQYYNVGKPGFAALEWPDGVAFLFPADRDPLGFRVSTYDPETGRWDLVSAPGGPMAFLPANGSAPGMFDFLGLLLQHDAISLPAIIDGAQGGSPVGFPSSNVLLFGSPVFDPTQEVLVDLGYAVEGHQVAFEDLVAEPLGGGLFGVPFGIPQYGAYVLTSADFEQAGIQPPETWDQFAEVLRALGTAGWTVGETEGPLHGPLTWPWVEQGSELHHPYDPELAAQLLEEAGWPRDD